MKKCLCLLLSIVILLAAGLGGDNEAQNFFKEDFEKYGAGKLLPEDVGWDVFPGIRGENRPQAIVTADKGVNGSRALALFHTKVFRSDGIGLHRKLPKPLSDGVIWLQCRVKAPEKKWLSPFYFAARAGRSTAARIVGAASTSKDNPKIRERWHATWRPGYRNYMGMEPSEKPWRTATMRLDFKRGSYAAWIDDMILGEDLPLNATGAVTHLYVGVGGSKEDPAYIDDITVSRQPPQGLELRALLPEKGKGLLFRFAAVGDPQLGFANYSDDVSRFRWAVQQINEAGVDFSVIPGDLVHKDDDEKAYRDFRKLADGLTKPWYPVRGNHDRKDLYQKHFGKPLDYAFEHKGFRFVMLDAIGNHAGLSKKQMEWAAEQFRHAAAKKQEIVVSMHVSPWENNERGRSKYNQIGPGRNKLRELFRRHRVLLCLSGHYHRGLWHAHEEQTHYLVLGGTSRVRFGSVGWCLFDVYADRVVMYKRPLWFAYERPDTQWFYDTNYLVKRQYADAKKAQP